jgi:hypothetical protein
MQDIRSVTGTHPRPEPSISDALCKAAAYLVIVLHTMDNTLAGEGFTVGIPVNQRRRTSDMKMLVYKAIHAGRMSHLCRKVIDLARPRGPAFVCLKKFK